MTRVRRLIDETLHTGEISYLVGEARTGVPFPVLEDVLEGQYKACVATVPFEGPQSLFYRIYEPTRAMRLLATDVFPGYAGRPARPVTREGTIWRYVQMIYRQAHSGAAADRPDVEPRLAEIAFDLSEQAGETVSPMSLSVAAVAYEELGALVLSNSLAASVIPASLLVMAGVPREMVACFGVYYQDPVRYRAPHTGWTGGFYVPSPTHVVFGVYLGARWVPVDFTRPPHETRGTLPAEPISFLRRPDFGQREDDDAPEVADFAHPYTMVFPTAAPDEQSFDPVLKYIPLL